MENKKKVFISTPMSGKDEALIKRSIQLAKRSYCRKNKISARDVDFYNNLEEVKCLEKRNDVTIEDAEMILHKPVAYLGIAIQVLSACDEAIFTRGWKDARGCRIEHEVCVQYGIPFDDQDE